MADQNEDTKTHTGPTLVSSASTQPSNPEPVVQAPTAALIGKVMTSGDQGGSKASKSSMKSTQSALTERRRRKAAEAAKPRPWPDDRKYNPRSLFLFTLQNPIRQTAIRCIEWPGWDRKVIIIIMINTVCLAMYDPFDVESMRACDPDVPLSVPYLYCDKWGTGTFLLPFCMNHE